MVMSRPEAVRKFEKSPRFRSSSGAVAVRLLAPARDVAPPPTPRNVGARSGNHGRREQHQRIRTAAIQGQIQDRLVADHSRNPSCGGMTEKFTPCCRCLLYSKAMSKLTISLFLTLTPVLMQAATGYLVHNLVADDPSTAVADFYDPRLVNPWGNVASATSPFWVCDGGTGLSTIYTVHPTNATPLGTPNAATQPTVPGAGG